MVPMEDTTIPQEETTVTFRYNTSAHKGKDCKDKRRHWHKNEAPFDNKMGGSTDYYQVINE